MIAVDAMGGDHAPHASVCGSYNAAKKGIPLSLFGKKDVIAAILDSIDQKWQLLPIEIVHCDQIISMNEEPVKTVFSKKDSSLIRAVESVSYGKTKAIVSAGNSGAALVAGMTILGTIPGVLRPAIGNYLPTKTGSAFCLDLGANVDCKAEYLLQFAFIGTRYLQLLKNIKNPRVALLSNGQEPSKGNVITKKAYILLQRELSLNFIGNIEPKEILEGSADLVISDGFAGNIMLKAMESTASAISYWLKKEYETSFFTKCLGALNNQILSNVKKKIDYAQQGGALLLGVKHPFIIAHGCSCAFAIEQAISFAFQISKNAALHSFNDSLTKDFEFNNNEQVEARFMKNSLPQTLNS